MGRYLSGELYSIALGRIPTAKNYHINSCRTGVDTTSAKTIWSGANNYIFPTTAGTLTVVSTDALDTQELKIEGLDANFLLQEETITLNGLTPVTTTKNFIRVYTISLQTGNSNVGKITATFDSNASVAAEINIGRGNSEMAVFTIPANYNGMMIQGSCSAGAGKDVQIEFFARTYDKDSDTYSPFKIYHVVNLFETAYVYKAAIPQLLPPRTDFDVRVLGFSNDSGAHISAVVEILLQEINSDY